MNIGGYFNVRLLFKPTSTLAGRVAKIGGVGVGRKSGGRVTGVHHMCEPAAEVTPGSHVMSSSSIIISLSLSSILSSVSEPGEPYI